MRAHQIAAVDISDRLEFANAIGAGFQVVKLVAALAVGLQGTNHVAIGIEQLNGHSGNGRFALLVDTVAVRVVPHHAGNAHRQEFAEVVVDEVGAVHIQLRE